MFFIFLFFLASALALSLGNFRTTDTPLDLILLIMLMGAVFPWMIGIVRVIRQDMEKQHSLFTRSGLIGAGVGILLFWGGYVMSILSPMALILFASIFMIGYYRMDARIAFGVALGALLVTIGALLTKQSAIAEQSSVVVYLSLVVGVVGELITPLFARLHRGATPVITPKESFIQEYRQALSEYAWMSGVAIGILIVVLCVFQWHFFRGFRFEILFIMMIGMWVFFALFLFTRERIYTYRDFLADDFGVLPHRHIPHAPESPEMPLISKTSQWRIPLIIGISIIVTLLALWSADTLGVQVSPLLKIALALLIVVILYTIPRLIRIIAPYD